MKIKLLLVLFLSLFIFNPAFSKEEKKVVRVAISNQNFSNYVFTTTKISSDGLIKILDLAKNTQLDAIQPNKTVEIVIEDDFYSVYVDSKLQFANLTGPLLISSNSQLQLLELNRKGIPAKYEGMIEIKKAKNNCGFNIINVVDMQNYLRGVVPNEMPVSFGLEALKAQSIAARNYALNANMTSDYDLVDSTAAQVYYGANSYKNVTDEAILKTHGIYALYNEKPIMALYFSTSSGITDDWDDVFNNGEKSDLHPYLKARPDFENQDFLKNENDVVKFYSQNGNGLDINSPKFRWNIEFTRQELEQVLHTTLQQQSKAGLVEPKYDGDIVLEGLKDIKPIKRTQSGKIVELLIESKTGNYKVKKELGIRRVLRKNNAMLPSGNFFVEFEGKERLAGDKENEPKVQESGLIKLFDIIDDERYPTIIRFIGGGFGHGVGMSQFGASNLAKQGKKYPEILSHYYSDINISTVPKTIEYSGFNMSSKTEFYFDNEIHSQAFLIIDNERNVSEFPFKINNYEFNDTHSASRNKLIKINITQYLNNGENVINFAPLTRENKGKQITYRVEFL